MLLSKIFLVNLSEKAIKQRRPTTPITVITVNNETKQDGVTVNTEIVEIRRGAVCFASSFSCTPDFFFLCFPSGS